jgi:ATP-dependent Lhr-like helicase
VDRQEPGNELIHLEGPGSADAALGSLAEPLRRWFRQCFAWSGLASSPHLLLGAPTGTGKTLAAFLPILNDLFAKPSPSVSLWAALRSSVRCLYVAPLKALVNDMARTLTGHLDELTTFIPTGRRPTVLTRTGDSTAAERRALRESPPDILLTTPESLAVLLTQPFCHSLFSGLQWIVVDEVHALAVNKRGADLALSLERLSAIAVVEPRRIGLSATATPLEEAAKFLVGVGRSCVIAAVPDLSPVAIVVEPLPDEEGFLTELIACISPRLRANRATLIFTNARRLAERLAWGLRRAMPDWNESIAVHHSALAAERRQEIESAFKAGRLQAVVSSTSLELGIDIGSVDLVILVHPPGDVVRLLQRVGRAGHGPGRIRRGVVLTANPTELLEAAVTGASGRSAQCERLGFVEHPLDVLCQQILGMAALETCFEDEVFDRVRRAYPFRHLPRSDFDDCVAYLFGLDRRGEVWWPARRRRDGSGFTLRDQATARLLRRNLGTILAEEQTGVLLRPQPLGEPEPDFAGSLRVGEVDAAYAERLQPGDRFLLDGRCLEYRSRQEGSVLVDEVIGRPVAPVWGGEGLALSAELAQRLYLVRGQAAELLREGPNHLAEWLRDDYNLDPRAVAVLVAYFQQQECVSEIPEQTVCLIEGVQGERDATYYIHTPLNRLGNDAIARVAVQRLVRDHGRSVRSLVADLGFAITVRSPLAALQGLIRALLAEKDFDTDLAMALADSIPLRERFRHVALTGFMLLRNPLGKRRRVGGREWGDRQLFDQVRSRDPAFPLMRQAEREVRREVCDLSAALGYVRLLPRLSVRCRWLAQPSPFVESWTRLALGSLETVETPTAALRRLHAKLTAGTVETANVADAVI